MRIKYCCFPVFLSKVLYAKSTSTWQKQEHGPAHCHSCLEGWQDETEALLRCIQANVLMFIQICKSTCRLLDWTDYVDGVASVRSF